MEDINKPDFLIFFSDMPDPRVERTRRHELIDILFVAICATLSGAEDCVAMADYARGRRDWLKQRIALKGGPPSHDTFSRVLARLDPTAFARCFTAWIAAIQEKTDGQVIALDGKTVRRSFDKANGNAAIHMVSAWGCANGLVLGQIKTDDKSNEITAVPRLLEMLDINGCIVTLDAMGSQKAIARQIRKQGGDYVLAVKANQPDLRGDVQNFFDKASANRFLDADAEPIPYSYHKTIDGDHGRIETRECWASDHLSGVIAPEAWTDLRSLVRVCATRKIQDQETQETRYFICSLPPNAAELLHAVRSHWRIENSLHWVLDVTFHEDQNRTRKDNGPQNLATLRHIALNLCKKNTSRKASMRRKLNMAAWEPDFLEEILTNN